MIFFGTGSSAIDITNNLLVGRPYGGTAILYRKSLCDIIITKPKSNSRVTALEIHTVSGPLVFLTVYMPTEYNAEESLREIFRCLC